MDSLFGNNGEQNEMWEFHENIILEVWVVGCENTKKILTIAVVFLKKNSESLLVLCWNQFFSSDSVQYFSYFPILLSTFVVLKFTSNFK